ncbi:GNAT family N-acetyltransferase [Microvirga rosea]|uniref:GNAT family N-acetyltransferase n=1 Tax=Microvirga rosea TaxID=2715425 RepID=UPI001D0BBE5E|nr:GNAT family N-acetyltransferase [Microvirga rosea]MCB8821863.1 GNAT family N-acetyltransferase [Microvirga rosea]
MTDPASSVRSSRQDDLALLGDVERSAAEVYFAALGERAGLPDVMPPEILQACHDAGLLWVCVDGSDAPVGFLAAAAIDGVLFVKEMSVHSAHQRRGLGRLLMQRAIAHAADAGFTGIALTTDRFIPFNAPFYERLGFAECPLDQAPETLRLLCADEAAGGFDPERRVLMTRSVSVLQPATGPVYPGRPKETRA